MSADAIIQSKQESPRSQQNADEIAELQWFKKLSKGMNTVEKEEQDDGNENELEGITEGSYDYMLHTKPEVRSCNWEQFKNRYDAEGQSCCLIETLVSSDDLDGEMEAEQWKRLSAKQKKQKLQGPREPIRQLGNGKSQSRYLERVRINSEHVLDCLAKVTGEAS